MRWSKWEAHNPDKQEFEGFTDIVAQLSEIDIPKLDKTTKSRIAADIGFKNRTHRHAVAYGWSASAAVFLMVVLVFAQSAQPGSALYLVRKSSQKVRTVVHDALPFIPDEKSDAPELPNNKAGDNPGSVDDSRQNEIENNKSNLNDGGVDKIGSDLDSSLSSGLGSNDSGSSGSESLMDKVLVPSRNETLDLLKD